MLNRNFYWILGASLVMGCSDKAMRSAIDEGTGDTDEDISVTRSEQKSKRKAPLAPKARTRPRNPRAGQGGPQNERPQHEEPSDEGFMTFEWDMDPSLDRSEVLEALFPNWEIKRLLERHGNRSKLNVEILLREEETDEEAGQLLLAGFMNLELRIGDKTISSDFFNQGAVVFAAQGREDVMTATFRHTSGTTLYVSMKRQAPSRLSQVPHRPWRGRLELEDRGQGRRLGILDGVVGGLHPSD
jgi:hypothetical protein